jgi:hypothetical protein
MEDTGRLLLQVFGVLGTVVGGYTLVAEFVPALRLRWDRQHAGYARVGIALVSVSLILLGVAFASGEFNDSALFIPGMCLQITGHALRFIARMRSSPN